MWTARYLDSTSLPQFEENGEENLFKEIDEDKLERFEIFINEKNYGIDLVTGKFNIGDQQLYFAGFSPKESYTLIYFRRVRKDLSQGMQVLGTKVTHHIGWKCTLNGKEHQRVMRVDNDTGEVSFEVK